MEDKNSKKLDFHGLTFEMLLEAYKKNGMSASDAVSKIANELPEIHQEFIERTNKRQEK